MKAAKLLNFFIPPVGVDLGRLVLRLGLGISMLALHGLSKLQGFAELSTKFPDPLGVGSQASLALAVFAEVVGSVLLILGLLTRFAALTSLITMSVAFFLVHKAALSGEGSGELALIYGLGYFALFLAGGGKLSVDQAVGLNSSSATKS